MSRTLAVALVVPEYRTEVGGGGGLATVADFLRRVFQEAGWDVTLYSPRMSRRAPESRKVLHPSTWFRALTLYQRADGVITVGAHLAEVEAVRYLPRKALDSALGRADVIVIVAGSPALAHIAKRSKRPVVLQVATMIQAERRRLVRLQPPLHRLVSWATTLIADKMDRSAVRLPTVVVTENHWMESQCRSLGARSVELSPPGVDTHTFRPADSKGSGGYLVMVSRLGDPRKDLPTLFRAYSMARKRGLTAPLILAGRGHPAPDDLALVNKLGIGQFVSIRSDVALDELISILQRAELFVMSSTEEGLGIVLVEAMSCGLPVLSTATEGARFAVGDSGAGELVGIGDSQQLADGMLAWMNSPERRTHAGELARDRAEAIFSLESTGAKFTRIVEDAVIVATSERT